MPKRKIKKGFFRWIHLEAIVVIVAYLVISNIVLVSSVANNSLWVSVLVPIVFGAVSGCAFLYLFSHEDFFHFIKKIEKEEEKKEKKYLKQFRQWGRMVASVLISALGGPIFLALTVRFLYNEKEERYKIVLIANLISTLIIVAMAKGVWKIIF